MKFIQTSRFSIFLQITALLFIFPAVTPAHAALNGNTSLLFVINSYSGGLAIAVPGSGTFTAIDTPETGTVVTLTLGAVTVTDTRRSLSGLGSWTTSANSTNLLSATDTLTASTFSYASGIPIISGGSVSVTAQSRTSLDTSASVEAATAITGNHVVSWTPTLTIPVPALKPAGSYSGTITHSVS